MADPVLSNLTQLDVAKLLSEPSSRVRAELAGKLALEMDSPRLTDNEITLAQDIVRLMAKDVEVTVRAALSQSLRHVTRLPHDVALKLANDVENVALPILSHSEVLNDDDLAMIIKAGAASKQEAIASRPVVSEKVAEALIADAGEKVVATLMSNAGAKIDEKSFTKAIDRFSESDEVKEKMVKRAALPVTVTERLVTMVTDNLKEYLVSHHELSPTVATDLVMQSRERIIVNMSGGSTQQDLEKLVSQMYQNKRLTPSLVLRALCMGDVAFFEAAIACMANVPLINARILVHDAGRLGLKSLYAKSGMPPRFLPAVRVAIDVVHETEMDGGEHDRERYRSRVIQRVLTQFEDLGSEDLDYLLDRLGDMLAAA